MKRIYVCSPFRGQTGSAVEIDANVQHAREACKLVVEQGDCPIAPHLLFTQFLDDDVPSQREAGIRCGLALLATCDELYLWPRVAGEISKGMAAEVEAAKAIGIPVVSLVRGYHPGTDNVTWIQIRA